MIKSKLIHLSSGVGIYGLVFDDEPGAEIYAAATKKDQAGILFRDAKTFAEKSADKTELFRMLKHG